MPDFAVWVSGWFYLTIVLAALAIALGWPIVLRAPASRWDRVTMGVATVSHLWYLAIFLLPRIAPSYTDLRFGTICVNLAVMTAAAVFSVFRSRPARRYLVASTWLLVCLWFYMMVVSSVV